MNSLLHDDELSIDNGLVRKLVDSEFPRYSSLSLDNLHESGSTNKLFRLGDDLLVRLPRQPGGSVAINKEQRWLGEIDRHLPIVVPEIVAVGKPAFGYSERWSIVRWINGKTPETCASTDLPTSARLKLAADLAAVIKALRAVKVNRSMAEDPTLRCYRGRPLIEFDQLTRHNIQRCRSIKGLCIDLDTALTIWGEAMELPDAHNIRKDCLYHGDLVAENLLLQDGKLTAVLDFGGLGVGNASVDLHGAWELFDLTSRDVFRSQLEVTDTEWLCGKAWALGIALNAIPYYWTTMPNRMQDRIKMIQSVLEDATSRSNPAD